MLSAYAGISAMYLDLNNPGSLEARQINDLVNDIFVITILCSLPLLIEKLKGFKEWESKYNACDDTDKNAMVWAILKPLLIKIGFVIVLAFIIAMIMQSYFGFDQKTMENYKQFYSNPKPIDLP